MEGIKYDLDFVKDEFIKRGFQPLFDEYKGMNEKLLCLNQDGYKVVISLSKLKLGRKPRMVNTNNPYSIENIRKWLKDNDKNIILLSDKYTGIFDHMKWQCLNDETHVIYTSWSSVKSGSECGYCTGKIKYTQDVFIDKVKVVLPDIEIIGEYKGIYDDIKCRCKIHGNIFNTTARSLLKGNGCKICSGYTEYNLTEFKSKVNDIYNHIEVIDDKYINTKTPIKCRCNIHNLEWYANPCTLINKNKHVHGCPQCTSDAVRGENAYNWKGGWSDIGRTARAALTEWKKDSMNACGYKCVITGERFEDIHHLHSFTNILNQALDELEFKDIENRCDISDEEMEVLKSKVAELHKLYPLGVCLSYEAHEEFHKEYTYYNNTPEQFYEFYHNKTGRVFLDDYPKINEMILIEP